MLVHSRSSMSFSRVIIKCHLSSMLPARWPPPIEAAVKILDATMQRKQGPRRERRPALAARTPPARKHAARRAWQITFEEIKTKIDSPSGRCYSPEQVKHMAQKDSLQAPPSQSPSGSALLGVDLGSNHIRIGTVDQNGKVLAFRREPYTDQSREDARALADHALSVARYRHSVRAFVLPDDSDSNRMIGTIETRVKFADISKDDDSSGLIVLRSRRAPGFGHNKSAKGKCQSHRN